MDTLISTYETALQAQISKYQDYVNTQFDAISAPENAKQLPTAKHNFNTKSGIVFIVIGVLAFIIGLFINTGLWIAGATSLASGVYLIIKGKQELTLQAYQAEGNSIIGKIDSIVGHVSKDWVEFLDKQNSSLRHDLVTTPGIDTDIRVKALNRITDNSYLHVDMAKIQTEMLAVDEDENVTDYKSYLPKAKAEVADAVRLAGKAQLDIYDALGAMPPSVVTTGKDIPD